MGDSHMIKGINSSSRHLSVVGGTPTTPYINPYSSNAHGMGNVRYNVQSNSMEVYDGNSWCPISGGYATIELTPDTEALLDWAKKKKNEDMQLESLMDKHPGLKEAFERLEIMKALTLEAEKVEQK